MVNLVDRNWEPSCRSSTATANLTLKIIPTRVGAITRLSDDLACASPFVGPVRTPPLVDTWRVMERMGREAFEQLYERHCGAVRAYVRRRVDDDAVDDVLADTWLTAWRRRDSLPEDVAPWLYATARRVLANHRRGARRRVALFRRMAEQPQHIRDAPGSGLAVALSALSDSDRETLMLVAWEGLDHAAAGRVLGCSANAFGVRLHRARARLARVLSDMAPDHDLQEMT